MEEKILNFLAALDQALIPKAKGQRLDLYLLGRAAMILHHGLNLGTKDVDFLWRHSDLECVALEEFGEGTPKAVELDMYLQRVSTGLPPVPAGFEARSTPLSGKWQVLHVFLLDSTDLAATKLKRFATKDRQDIQWLCDQGLLQPDALRAALENAFLWDMEKDGDPTRERAFRHLERVIEYLEGKLTSL